MTLTLDSTVAARLDPIGLDELNASHALMHRVDRKYLVPTSRLAELLTDLPGEARILTIDGRTSFNYRSTYFDTPDLVCYLQAARRRPRRIKVRTRHYLDSGERYLEVKTRQQGWTHKQRVTASADRTIDALGTELIESAAAAQGLALQVSALRPSLTCDYRRSTIQLPDDGARMTLDQGLVWHDAELSAGLDDWVVIETKGGLHPGRVDRLLWRAGHRPARASKYCTGLAALYPDLPHHRWHRTLLRLAS